MAFEIFTADTIAGRFRVAVKVRKDAFPGDNRSDAYSVMESQWGRCARLSGNSNVMRKLTADFVEAATAPGWGYVARIRA